MPSSVREQGMGIAVSSSHIFAALSSSFSSLTHRKHPRTSMWGLPRGCSFALPAPVWVPSPTGGSPGAVCFSARLPQVHKSCLKTCSSTCSSTHGATGPARTLLQCRAPTRLLWVYPWLWPWHGVPVGCGGYVLCCGPVWAEGDSLPHLFPTGCKIICSPVPGIPSPLLSSRT